jgi:hypothetical protein
MLIRFVSKQALGPQFPTNHNGFPPVADRRSQPTEGRLTWVPEQRVRMRNKGRAIAWTMAQKTMEHEDLGEMSE